MANPRDESCFRVVTISGAMTIAKRGLLLCEMIDRGRVDAIVTTGARQKDALPRGRPQRTKRPLPMLT